MNNPNSTNNQAQVANDDEIDLLDLAKTFWEGRKTILKSILFFTTFGVLIALVSPKEYTAATSMVPQSGQQENKLGGLSSLAAMAGFNLDANSSNDVLTPLVYPQIVTSTPFQLELMNTTFSFAEVDHPISLLEYYTKVASPGILSLIKKYTIGLPGIIVSAIKGKGMLVKSVENGLISLTEDQENIRKIIEDKVVLDLDSKQGFLTLTASFPEALLSAQIAEKASQLLQKYITQYKINKASDQLNFINQRYREVKVEFENAQERLARFRDENKNVTSAIARTQEERLQGEYTIALNVFNELAKQLEQAKIKVKEETPVFSILEPAIVPMEKSKPKRSLIVAIWLFLGGIIGTGIVFGKELTRDIRGRWNKTA